MCERTDTSFELPVRLAVQYVLFGSYRTEPKSVDLTADGIQFNTKFKYRDINKKFVNYIRIGFDETRHLYHCLDESLPLMAISLTEQSSERIRKSIPIGDHSAEDGCDDPNHHYIIIVLKERIESSVANVFIDSNPSVIYEEIDAEEAERLLNTALGKGTGVLSPISPSTDQSEYSSEPSRSVSPSKSIESLVPEEEPVIDDINEEESEELSELVVHEGNEEEDEEEDEEEEDEEEDEESDLDDNEQNEWNIWYKKLAALVGTRMEATAQFDAHYMLSQLNLLFRSVKKRNDSLVRRRPQTD